MKAAQFILAMLAIITLVGVITASAKTMPPTSYKNPVSDSVYLVADKACVIDMSGPLDAHYFQQIEVDIIHCLLMETCSRETGYSSLTECRDAKLQSLPND